MCYWSDLSNTIERGIGIGVLGWNIAIGIGIVKGLSKYWYWVLLRAFQSIGIEYC